METACAEDREPERAGKRSGAWWQATAWTDVAATCGPALHTALENEMNGATMVARRGVDPGEAFSPTFRLPRRFFLRLARAAHVRRAGRRPRSAVVRKGSVLPTARRQRRYFVFFWGVTGFSFGFLLALNVGCTVLSRLGLAFFGLRVLPAARRFPLSTKRMVTACDLVSGSSV